jgi:carbamoyltransferase
MKSYRIFDSAEVGFGIKVPKPYFNKTNNLLVMKNVPPGRWSKEEKSSDSYNIFKKTGQRILPILYKISDNLGNNFHKKIFDDDLCIQDYSSSKTEGWMLMKALLESFIASSKGRPIFLIPIPHSDYAIRCLEPIYLERLKQLSSVHQNVRIIDVLSSLEMYSFEERKKFFIPNDGHFSKKANKIISERVSTEIKATMLPNKKEHNSESSVLSQSPVNDYLLGISCFYHDSAAALLCNGELVSAAQEERFTRYKHDKSFPVNSISYCLEQAGIETNDIRAVCYYDNMSLTLERIFQTQLQLGKNGKDLWLSSIPSWIKLKLNLGKLLKEKIGYEGKIFQTLHHRSHAASTFYMSPFDEAAILTCDGVGEFTTASIGYGKGNQVKLIKEMHFPHSVGLFYSAFTSFTGFRVNSGEYKMMGLAPYGKPRYENLIRENIININDDGSIYLNMDYFDFMGGKRMFNDKINGLLDGPPRELESKISQREMDIAKSVQNITEDILLRMANHAKKITGSQYLTMAGGVALNCVANGKLLRSGLFEDIWIQPASGDAGGAVGACLDVYHNYLKKPRKKPDGFAPQKGSFWGPEYSNEEIDAYLNTNDYPFYTLSESDRADTIASLLVKGNVIGHFSGRMEFGPRALGSRSIMGDPRSIEMQSILNLKIKYRESFRPFAPAVIEEKVQEYFELDRPSPYMLLVADVKKERRKKQNEITNSDLMKRLKKERSDIPSITHVDYSARVQTVNKRDNPQFYNIIKAFEDITGIAVVVNTSFNVRGEPIVCTPQDAYRCFMRTEMDVLVLEDRILYKSGQPKWIEEKDWRREFELD